MEKIDLLSILYCFIIIIIIFNSFLSFFLLIIGYFYYWLIVLANIIFVIVTLLVYLLKYKKDFPHISLNKISLIFAIILVLFIFLAPPFDIISSYDDGHLYLNGGIAMANYHSLFFTDNVDKELTPEEYTLYDSGFNYMPFYEGAIRLPSTLHFVHIWVALLYLFGGLSMVFRLNYIFGLLSIITFYKIIRFFTKKSTSYITTTLFAICNIELWFIKYPNTEILFQFLLLSFLLFIILYFSTKKIFYRIIYIFLLSLMLLTRIEGIVIISSFLLFLIFKNIYIDKKFQPKDYLDLVFPICFSLYYYLFIVNEYIFSNFNTADQPWTLFSILIFSIFLILYLFSKSGDKLNSILNENKKTIFWTIIIALILYMLFYKPAIGFRISNIIMMSWYLNPLITLLGFLGIIFFLRLLIETEYFLDVKYISIFFVLLPLSFIFIDNIHNRMVNPWVMRRLIISAIPFVFFGFGIFIDRYKRIQKGKIRILLCFLLILISLSSSSTIYTYVEMKNSYNQIQEIFGSYGDNDRIIYLDASYPQFAFPVKFIMQKNVIMANRHNFNSPFITPINETDRRILLGIIKKWLSTDKDIYLINPQEPLITWLNDEGYKLELVSSEKIDIDRDLTRTGYAQPKSFDSLSRSIYTYQVRKEYLS